jgi:Mat/Ecp fimbriae major subunit
MKNSMIKALASAAFLAASFGATSAQAATADADARATILTKVEVAKVAGTDLDFGVIAIGSLASGSATVKVENDGSRPAANCGTGLVCSGTTDAAEFNITGSVGELIAISVPASVVLTHATTASTMSATLSTDAATGNHALTAGETFAVGGTLTVDSAQEAGAYTGTFTVEVTYQ